MIVWDNHTCLPLRPHDERFLPQLQRARKAGVHVVGVNVGFGEQTIEDHVRMLAHFRDWIARHPDQYMLVERVGDVEAARDSGRLGIFFDIEGAGAIDDQLSMIGLYYDLGVRWMSIAYNLNNRVGGGCMDDDTGLTEFGVQAVDEMARVGMITCCSHTGERTVLDVIDHAKNPVIFSHSNPRALRDHPRNINDIVIRKCAAKGGVIGINGVGVFLGDNDIRSETIARNIDYVAQLVGVEHVAIGLDYVYDNTEVLHYMRKRPQLFGQDSQAQLGGAVCDFAPPEQIPEISHCLWTIGYGKTDLELIFGLNLLRVARAVWK